MAKVYLDEYGDFRNARPFGGPVAVQTPITAGGASVPSAPFSAQTNFIRVHVIAPTSYKIGLSPVADVDDMRIPADGTRDFAVEPGQRIAFIDNP